MNARFPASRWSAHLNDEDKGPGADLRAAREAMEVSPREVADALNLSVYVIECLEANDHEKLPPSVFTRGYLRSYARLLELDPEELLSRYPEVTEEVEIAESTPPATEPLRPDNRKLMLAGGAVGLLLIVGLLLWWLGGDRREKVDGAQGGAGSDVLTTDMEDSAAAGAPAGSPGAEMRSDRNDVPAEERHAEQVMDAPRQITREEVSRRPEETAAGVDPAAQTTRSDPFTDDASEAAVESAVSGDEAQRTSFVRERRITEFGDDRLRFTFSDECWVEVKSATGENLYSDLNRAGRTLILTGSGPFRILLGYAPGVTLEFNGEPVPLDRYTRNNVANLVLGQ